MTTKVRITNESDRSDPHVIKVLTSNLEKRILYPGSSTDVYVWTGTQITITEINTETTETEFGALIPNDNDIR